MNELEEQGGNVRERDGSITDEGQQLNEQEEQGDDATGRDGSINPPNGLILGTGIFGWTLAALFALLYGLEVAKSVAPMGGNDFPTPVIIKLKKKVYVENQDYERMIIQGANGSDTATASDPESTAGILRWVNQQGFWYLEIFPVTSSGKDCLITNPEDLFGKRYSPIAYNSQNESSCNHYDFRLVIFNDLEEGATVHFHGLMPPSNQDGVPFVSNAKVHPGNLQRYRFNQNTYPGLHWMHAHTGFHQAFGVAAPIILQHSDSYIENTNFQRKDDVVIMFEEGFIYPKCAYSPVAWYDNECKTIPKKDHAKLAFFMNRREEPLDHTPNDGIEHIRIRFLNGGSEAPWRIDGTNLTEGGMEILATDGQDVERGVYRKKFVLGLANRIDVLVKIEPNRDMLITGIQMKHSGNVRDPALRHIVIRGRSTPNDKKIDIRNLPTFANNTNSPILKNFDLMADLTASHPFPERNFTRSFTVWNRGGDQQGGFPLTIFEGLKSLKDFNATPLTGPVHNYTQLNQLKFQLPPYKRYRNKKTGMVISTRRNCAACSSDHDSGIRERPPSGSNKYNILYTHENSPPKGDDTCCWEWCDVPPEECEDFELEDVKNYEPNTNYIPVCFGDRVRILFINTASFEAQEGHPMHLHGHDFVLRKLYDIKDGKDLIPDDSQTFDITGPKVDTIWVPFDRALTFEFDAFNPGEHLFHCHNDFHLENGMMTTIRYMHDDYCQDLPEFKGGENKYPTQFCGMDDCTPAELSEKKELDI